MSESNGRIEDRLRAMALQEGATHFGIADMTRAREVWPESFEECGPLLTGISIGIRRDDDLLDGLPMTDHEARVDHYLVRIRGALAIGDKIVDELTAEGYRAHRLSHPPRIKPTGLFKLTARLAGLGWIGKNRLLVTPDAGPRLSLAAVLTDAPLQPTATEPMPDGCGECTLCIEACPVGAYSTEHFGETDSMEGFDTELCAANRGTINPGVWGLCGLCVQICPLGRGYGEPTRPSERFKTVTISEEFKSEAVGCGDFNRDGRLDIVAGPYWYEGPDFKKRHRIFEVGALNPRVYSPTTQPCFVHDFNGDGWPDVFYVKRPPGPGQNYVFRGWQDAAGWAGIWYENPADSGGPWTPHQVVDNIANETAVWADVNGDGRPEMVYSTREAYGYATFDPVRSEQPWTFHPVSDTGDYGLEHGVGVGDFTGNGRMDILSGRGWWEQPETGASERPWTWHPFLFAQAPVQMFAYDVDGDGHNDIITVWHAHRYGLLWYRQVRDRSGRIEWERHEILPPEPDAQSRILRISQMHSLALADMDGDGLMDIVTGKRFWAHGPHGDPEPDAPAVLYWFQLRREPAGVRFVPHMIYGDCGAGSQIALADLGGSGMPDVVTSNKKGTYVHLNMMQSVAPEPDHGDPEPR
jgi:ferredoxin